MVRTLPKSSESEAHSGTNWKIKYIKRNNFVNRSWTTKIQLQYTYRVYSIHENRVTNQIIGWNKSFGNVDSF